MLIVYMLAQLMTQGTAAHMIKRWGQNGHAQSASTSSAWDGGAKTSQTAPPVVKAVGADEVSSHTLNCS